MLIPFKNEKLVNIVVLKNGFSTLGAVYSKLYKNNELEEEDSTWDNIYYDINNNNVDYESRTFFVYRDPYERLISIYKDIYTNKISHSSFLKLFGGNRNNALNIDTFVNECLKKMNMDDHINKQSNVIKKSGYVPDFMVRMEDLSDFIEQELCPGYKKKHNQSLKDIDVSGFEKYKKIIMLAYKSDYDLYESYKDKMWKKKE